MADQSQQLQHAVEGRYRIERELGAGGMATVYLAHDARHERPVAIKVLKPELAAVLGGERFLKEIRLTANLQHPHILALHDSGEADGLVYYVMPYVEGESLRDRLSREKQLPVEEAVRIGREVASALDYAHRHGVVHRDIKPENILLHEGQALVADFGIALAASTVGGTRMTETGMSLGTPHYMSPEQAMGEKDITSRSDVYALGCVLYEMLVGEPPFTGPTAQAIVAKVMTDDPRPISIHRRTVPHNVEAAVLKALAKLPADRFGTAAQFAEALTGAPAAMPTTGGTAAAPARTPSRKATGLWVVVGAAALAAGFIAGRGARQVDVPVPARFALITSEDHRITGAPSGLVSVAPDGRAVVYSGQNSRGGQLYLRRMESLEATPIPGTEGGLDPVVSPDGTWVLFQVGGVWKKVLVAGGAAVPIPVPVGVGFGLAPVWLDGERFLYTSVEGGLVATNPDGTTRPVLFPDTTVGEWLLLPFAVLPDGITALVTAAVGGGLSGSVLAVHTGTGRRTTIVEGAAAGAGYDRGALVWVMGDGTLFAAPFDARRLRLAGSPVTLAQNVRVAVGGPPALTVSKSNSLVYVPALPFDLTLVDRSGRALSLTDAQRRFHSPRFSPDGRRIALDFTQQASRDVWVFDRQQRTFTRLTFDNDGHDPVWQPDGRRISYATARGGIIGVFLRSADGSGQPESVHVGRGAMTVGTYASDGTAIAYGTGVGGGWDIMTIPPAGQRTPQPILATSFNEQYPALSPDGRWLAYTSDESGRNEVYVVPFPGPGAKVLVSRSGGIEPVWSPDGRELFYRGYSERGTPLVAATVRTTPEFQVVSTAELFDIADYESAAPHANYDISPDGRSFVMVRQGRLSEMVLIQNWTELAKGGGSAR